MTKVFLSSTWVDLQEHRRAVIDALERLRHQGLDIEWQGMEYFGAKDDSPANICLEGVGWADVYIGILGLRYGSIDPHQGLSMTEAEYRHAVSQGKHRLLFLIDEQYAQATMARHGEKDAQARAKLKKLKADVLADRCIEAHCTDPGDLSARVVTALQPYLPPLTGRASVEEPYLRFLVEADCRYLPLRGRDPRESTQAGLPLRLERVYIALNSTERPATPEKAIRPEALEREEQKPISALRLTLDNRCLLLLGEPGSGKSTFAEHLALCLAGERWQPGSGWLDWLAAHDASWSGRAPLPVRLRLREFAADATCLPTDEHLTGKAEHLLAYLEKTLRRGNFPNLPAHVLGLLDSGDVLFGA